MRALFPHAYLNATASAPSVHSLETGSSCPYNCPKDTALGFRVVTFVCTHWELSNWERQAEAEQMLQAMRQQAGAVAATSQHMLGSE